MRQTGVTESYVVKRQVLLSASEAAEMILRVDDIIKAAPRRREVDRSHCWRNCVSLFGIFCFRKWTVRSIAARTSFPPVAPLEEFFCEMSAFLLFVSVKFLSLRLVLFPLPPSKIIKLIHWTKCLLRLLHTDFILCLNGVKRSARNPVFRKFPRMEVSRESSRQFSLFGSDTRRRKWLSE